MIHRSFLFRAFQSPRYAYTRRTCVAAATTILRQCEALAHSDTVTVWTHTAFSISACVVLSFEVLYRLEFAIGEVDQIRALIATSRTRLRNRSEDILAKRGALLIDAICREGPVLDSQDESDICSSSSWYPVDIQRIIGNFISATRGDDFVQHFVPAEDDSGDISNTNELLEQQHSDMQDDVALAEFEDWYEQTFSINLDSYVV